MDHGCLDTGYVQQPHSQSSDWFADCPSRAEWGSGPFGAYAARQWSQRAVVMYKPPASKIKVSMDTPSLIPWDLSRPAPCWPAEGSAPQLPLFAHSSGSWRWHTHLPAEIRWNREEFSLYTKTMSLASLCCVRGAFTLTLLQLDTRFYLPCPESPRRCLCSWAEQALKDWFVQALHLCPAPESLQKPKKISELH